MRATHTLALACALLALAGGARAIQPTDCVNELSFASSSAFGVDVKVTYTTPEGAKVTGTAKTPTASRAKIDGVVPVAFRPAVAGQCPNDNGTPSLPPKDPAVAALFSQLAPTEVGAPGGGKYGGAVGTAVGSFKKGNSASASFTDLSYSISDLKINIQSPSGVTLSKADGAKKFTPPKDGLVTGSLVVTLEYKKSGSVGKITETVQLSGATVKKVGSCGLVLRKASGFNLECKNLLITLNPVTVSPAAGGSLLVTVILRGSAVSAASPLSATKMATPPPPVVTLTAADDVGAWAVHSPGEQATCKSSVLLNDAGSDWNATRVYLKCVTGWVEVLSMVEKTGKNGCTWREGPIPGPGDDEEVGAEVENAGFTEDPLYDEGNFPKAYFMKLYATQADAAYTAVAEYKLVHAGGKEATGKMSCAVPASTQI
ncbi:MAG: hypothetical protein J3K34DRAFT_519483 [Monoraphidium minutum]|nr:MAG: hypothetical protein J3K34DRAFT_519483 [Monoraphidium minutum]